MADEETQQPLNPDLMGYPSVEALVAAKRASDQEAIRLKERANRADELERMLAAQNVANPRQSVPNRPRYEETLETIGLPLDALDQYVESRVERKVQQQMEPIYRLGTARTQALAKHKDYGKFEADIGTFINSDPKIQETYNRIFSADPAGAFDWAYYEFGRSRRDAYTNGAGGEPPTSGAAHAAIPSQRAGDTRQLPQNEELAIQEARQRYNENPTSRNAEAYAKARLKQVISEDFLRQ